MSFSFGFTGEAQAGTDGGGQPAPAQPAAGAPPGPAPPGYFWGGVSWIPLPPTAGGPTGMDQANAGAVQYGGSTLGPSGLVALGQATLHGAPTTRPVPPTTRAQWVSYYNHGGPAPF